MAGRLRTAHRNRCAARLHFHGALARHPTKVVSKRGGLGGTSSRQFGLLLGEDLVKTATVGKVRLVGRSPAAKGLVNREQVELGQLFGVRGLRLG